MNEPIRIVIAGEVVPGKRPRFRNIRAKDGRSFVSTYNDPEQVKWQTQARYIAQEQMKNRPPFVGALAVKVEVYLPIPASFSGKKRVLAISQTIHPTVRPDLDNYIKQLDAFKGLLWLDDSQITKLDAFKSYSDRPRLEIEVSQIGEAARPVKDPEAELF